VRDLAELTVEDFAARVGEAFAMADGGVLTLAAAVALPTAPDAPRPQFSLDFAGSPDVIHPQSIYALTNEHLGTLEIFLVPISRDADAVHYQAVFA
jgi:uncharacterized protein DUF6916